MNYVRSGAVLWAALFLIPFAAANQTLRADLNQLFESQSPPTTTWSVLVQDAASGDTVFSLDSSRRLIPASNMKIVIGGAILMELGPEWQYETRLHATGPIENGTLRGDLVVLGSGDPSIGGRFRNGDITSIFSEWAQVLRQKGITRIDGNIIGNDSFFDRDRVGLLWHPDDWVEWYAAEVSALSLNDGCLDIQITAASGPGTNASIRLDPPTAYVTVSPTIRTIGSRQTERMRFTRNDGARQITIDGAIRQGRSTTRYVTVPDPAMFFTTVLSETLQSEGITHNGMVQTSSDPLPAPLTLLHTHRSPALSQLVAVCLRNSQNLYTEHLLKTLGAIRYGKGSFEMGARAVKDIFYEYGCDIDDMYIADGSGLSRSSRVSANDLVSILTAIQNSPMAEAFREALPKSGTNGTLRNRMRETLTRGRVAAKTGTLNGVRGLSGYIEARDGTAYIFSFLANGRRSASRFTGIMDEACSTIIEQG